MKTRSPVKHQRRIQVSLVPRIPAAKAPQTFPSLSFCNTFFMYIYIHMYSQYTLLHLEPKSSRPCLLHYWPPCKLFWSLLGMRCVRLSTWRFFLSDGQRSLNSRIPIHSCCDFLGVFFYHHNTTFVHFGSLRWGNPPEMNLIRIGVWYFTKFYGVFRRIVDSSDFRTREFYPMAHMVFCNERLSIYTTWKVDGATPMYCFIMAPS